MNGADGAGQEQAIQSGGSELPSRHAPRGVVPRRVPEGTVPLLALEGDAYECGRTYSELVQSRYPGYETYLAPAPAWRQLSPIVSRLFAQRAPYVPEIFRGLADSLGRRLSVAPPR